MDRRTLLYIAKRPPSHSGIANYAEDFATVLQRFAAVSWLDPADDSGRSQSLRAVIRTLRSAHRSLSNVDGVFVEIGGRCQAEFWTAWLLTFRSTPLWVTVHDAPHVAGGPFFVAALDRKGFRRVAAFLSRTLGALAERRVLGRARRAFTLSGAGSAALAQRYRVRAPAVIPHIVLPRPEAPRVPPVTIFCPGYATYDSVLPALAAIDRHPHVELLVGATTPADAAQIHHDSQRAGTSDRLTLLGYLDSRDDLESAFARSHIVLRFAGRRPANADSVSGVLYVAMAHGCAVVTNDGRGASRELLDAEAAFVVPDAEAIAAAIDELVHHPAELDAVGQRGRAFVSAAHSSDAVAAALRPYLVAGLDE